MRKITPFFLAIFFAATLTSGETPAAHRNTPAVQLNTSFNTSLVSLAHSAESGSGSAIRELKGADLPVAARPGEHPLLAALRWANEALPTIERMNDYSATFVKRERVDGTLGKRQTFLIKIRQKPFSVYIRGLTPASVKGEEAIYVAGKNDGKMWAHPAILPGRWMPTFSLDPKCSLAMRDQRYPITEIGIANMLRHMVAVADADAKHGDCEVHYFTGGKIDNRPCSWCEVVHPQPRPCFKFNVARIFVDNQSRLPIHYEAYTFPVEAGGQPQLLEAYSYLDVKANNGFTDEDFSTHNPAYHFR